MLRGGGYIHYPYIWRCSPKLFNYGTHYLALVNLHIFTLCSSFVQTIKLVVKMHIAEF